PEPLSVLLQLQWKHFNNLRKYTRRTLAGYASIGRANLPDVSHLSASVAPRRHRHSDLGNLYHNESVQKYLQLLLEEHRDICRRLQHVYLTESDRKVLRKRHTELLPLANIAEQLEVCKNARAPVSLISCSVLFVTI
uniref:Uncharacterized protein n=1 Tax=Echeneis naucrates TaxID=173247 RepID=A0A665X3Y4_ECHNA